MAEDFDVLIASTGLSESILAAALAKAGQRVLHLDSAQAYGSHDISFTLDELHQWAQEMPEAEATPAEIPPSLHASRRKFNLALRPTLVPALSPFVDTLVTSGAASYSGFRLLEAMALLQLGHSQAPPELKSIPTSKEEIFNSKALSLVEKRRVMKFLQFAIGNLDEAEGLQEPCTIGALLKDKFALTGVLLDSVLYGICFCDTDQEQSKSVLVRLQKYLRSGGRYGTSPFLIGQYGGSSEILQGFCRICAVYGGTYMLGSQLPDLPSPRDPGAAFDIPELGPVKASHVVTQSAKSLETTARAILILNQPVHATSSHTVAVRNADVEAPSGKEDKTTIVHRQAETALIVLPPTEGKPCVRAVMHGEGTFTAPQGHYVVYLSCVNSNGASAKEVLHPATEALLQLVKDGLSALLYSAYYNDRSPVRLSLDGREVGAGGEVPPLTEISDIATQEALRAFKSLTGKERLFEPEEKKGDEET